MIDRPALLGFCLAWPDHSNFASLKFNVCFLMHRTALKFGERCSDPQTLTVRSNRLNFRVDFSDGRSPTIQSKSWTLFECCFHYNCSDCEFETVSSSVGHLLYWVGNQYGAPNHLKSIKKSSPAKVCQLPLTQTNDPFESELNQNFW